MKEKEEIQEKFFERFLEIAELCKGYYAFKPLIEAYNEMVIKLNKLEDENHLKQ